MAEEEEEQEEQEQEKDKNKRIRPRERALSQKNLLEKVNMYNHQLYF